MKKYHHMERLIFAKENIKKGKEEGIGKMLTWGK